MLRMLVSLYEGMVLVTELSTVETYVVWCFDVISIASHVR